MSRITEIMETMEYGPAPEANGEVLDWLKRKTVIGHYIDGAVSEAGGRSEVQNPATGEHLAELAVAGEAEVEAAVAAARAAQPLWAGLSGHERARYLYAIARTVQKRERFLSVLESMDNGKPIRESRDIDIPLVARHFYHHAGWAEILETEFPGQSAYGVCGQIIPWNFPLLMLAWKVAPALAAGNTVVLKPADLTPLSAHALAEICVEVGLPKGVLNIVQGGAETGALIAGHPGIDKLAFTGSTEVGRVIRRQTAGSGKALSLELGGKSPFIVFEDADLDAAVEGVVDAVWFNQGEVCCASARLLLQEGIAERFLSRLRARLAKLRTGDPLDKCTDLGALVSAKQLERVEALIATGLAEGGVLERGPAPLSDRGAFCAPGLFTGLGTASTLAQTEIFGPIAVVMTFRTPDEAVALANDSRYGLAASVWSENVTKALDVAGRVRAGVVWINATNLLDAGAAFGGMRESGFGREGGREGLREYLRPDWLAKGALRKDKAFDWSPGPAETATAQAASGGIDITARLWIGGKFARADGGQSASIRGASGAVLGQMAVGSRKDIRNAVEAASKAGGWGGVSAHNRAQILYFLAENLDQRRGEFAELLSATTGGDGAAEVDLAVRRLFWNAAQADKVDGNLRATKSEHVTLHINEPFGVMGVVCPEEAPLLALVSLVAPALAMGNRVVCVPSQAGALVAARFAQVAAVSDLPAGVLNIVAGPRDALAKTLAEHDGVAALWYCGSAEGSAMVEAASAGNLKPVWADGGRRRDWTRSPEGQGETYLRRALQVKTLWLPYGA